VSELPRGTKAPTATLPGLAGGDIAIPGSAPLTLVVLLKASCPTCRWALPHYQALHEASRDRPLAVIGVFQGEAAASAVVAAEAGATFPLALEPAPWELSAAFDAVTVPTAILIDDEGKVVITSLGFSRDDLLEAGRRAAAIDGGDPIDPFPAGEEVPVFRPG
jgi:peroxiredoxin